MIHRSALFASVFLAGFAPATASAGKELRDTDLVNDPDNVPAELGPDEIHGFPALSTFEPLREIAPGLDYFELELPGPIRAYVLRLDLRQPGYDLIVGHPYGERESQIKERTTGIFQRYDEQLNAEGTDVVAAINGSFFGHGNDIIGLLASEGRMVGVSREELYWPTLVWTKANHPLALMDPRLSTPTLTLGNETRMRIDVLNEDLGEDAIGLYSQDWGDTLIVPAGVAVARVTDISGPVAPNSRVTGVLGEVSVKEGGDLVVEIPEDGLLIAASGSRAALLTSDVDVAVEYVFDDAPELAQADMMMDMGGYIVRDGEPYREQWPTYAEGFRKRHPRSLAAWDRQYLYLAVIDGRQEGYSVGVSFDELARFSTEVLDAREALNFDGGGSSALVLEGELKNRPSDPQGERFVGNAVLLTRKK